MFLTSTFYREAHCIFLTYDITRGQTFKNLTEWLKDIYQHAPDDCLGNKSEMENEKETNKEKAIEFAKANSLDMHFETSAKTGENVDVVFSLAAK